MADVSFHKPTPADIRELAANLRPADRAEIAALGVSDALKAIQMSVAASLSCRAVVEPYDGAVICIFGVSPESMLEGVGIPWMLGTSLVDVHAKSFVKYSGEYLERMLEQFPKLHNIVDARNIKAVRWLRRAGFEFGEPYRVPPEDILFYPFEMRAKVCA